MNLGELYQREYGGILASLIRAVRDFDLAEDALQEAFAAALAQWPVQGPLAHAHLARSLGTALSRWFYGEVAGMATLVTRGGI